MGLDTRATGVDWAAGGHHGMARFGEDSQLLVQFYNRSVQQKLASQEAGRPIYKDEIYVKIMQPGELLNIVDRPASDQDKQRFRTQWSNFVHDRTQVPEGTPVDLLFPNHPAVAENLRGMGVYTIEQCADLSANAIDNIGRGAQEYVNRAKKFLDASNKGGAFHLLQKEIEELKQDNRILQQKLSLAIDKINNSAIAVTDPVRASLSPPHIPNYDVQTDRINNTSPRAVPAAQPVQVATTSRRGRKATNTVEDKITDPFGGKEPDSDPNNYEIIDASGQ